MRSGWAGRPVPAACSPTTSNSCRSRWKVRHPLECRQGDSYRRRLMTTQCYTSSWLMSSLCRCWWKEKRRWQVCRRTSRYHYQQYK
jgi:hypothetical protein